MCRLETVYLFLVASNYFDYSAAVAPVEEEMGKRVGCHAILDYPEQITYTWHHVPFVCESSWVIYLDILLLCYVSVFICTLAAAPRLTATFLTSIPILAPCHACLGPAADLPDPGFGMTHSCAIGHLPRACPCSAQPGW